MSTTTIPRQRRAERPVRVFRYRGWNVVCRVCKRAVPNGEKREDHGSMLRAFFAAELHLEHVHGATCHDH